MGQKRNRLRKYPANKNLTFFVYVQGVPSMLTRVAANHNLASNHRMALNMKLATLKKKTMLNIQMKKITNLKKKSEDNIFLQFPIMLLESLHKHR